ncbi:MAG TPA: glycosyltransferase [Candidatus Krumholzibacteria bacterium]|nr:glycosyltransferase [Candidatus Krumholzibacteria bacterium]HPD72026.1 glycosyltransferase [Candidatus Krumholzibacteria bacterium]HRY41041.1 glycosyltransferase [Candidatus Krumholzibacteria bacterium]
MTTRIEPSRIFTEHGEPANFQPFRRNVGFARLPRVPRTVVQALVLWSRARRHRGLAAFVTYGGMTGFALAWIQTILKPLIAPRTHVMFDLLLERRRRGLAGLFDRLKMVAFREAGVRAMVWGMDDGDVFAREYDVPRDRFQFHPYHTTLDGFAVDPGDDGFLFAGGNNGRDYATLIAALREVEYPAIVATTNPDVPPLARGLPHVTVKGVSPEEFRRLLARCTLLVEAHPPDFIRTAGHQTLLNAMSLGKPIVMADRRSAPGYLEHGREGLVVAAGDAAGLAAAVKELLADRERRARMAEAGRTRLADPLYGTAQHMQSIYNYALRLEHRRTGRSGEPELIECYGPATVGILPPEFA